MATLEEIKAKLKAAQVKVEEAKIKAAASLAKKEIINNEAKKLLISSDIALKEKQLLIKQKNKQISTLQAQEVMLNNYRLQKLRRTLRKRQRIGK
jgi:hypothetical protein|tara:strand:+ start:1808 stop:2092 length:285 start_codon:yes stop_codon:yes gene_type:complete